MIIYKIGSQKERNNLPAYSRPRHRRPPNLNVHFVICRIRNGGAKGVLASRCFVLGGCQSRHKFLPFHRIEKWNGKYFQAGALWQVGVKLQLGHDGFGCPGAANVEGESITTFLGMQKVLNGGSRMSRTHRQHRIYGRRRRRTGRGRR